MQKSKRTALIYEYIKEHKDVQIADIAKYAETSQSTVRRDIKELVLKGLVIELYGSVILNEKNDSDIQIKQRATMQSLEKKQIGIQAAKLIKDNSLVFIDAGTTTKEMIPHIHASGCTYVTNGIEIALELIKLGFDVHIVGGRVKPITEAIVGEFALEFIKLLHFDVAFIGTNGVSELGYSTPDVKEGILKRQVIQNSRKSYILGDKSKKDKTTAFIFAQLDQATWIHEGRSES